MVFLLTALNAKYIHSNPAVYSLKRFAGKNAACVQIAEYTINNRMEDILEDIYRRKPDVIGFSCYIWNIAMIREIITELHKLRPDLPIFLGGPEVTYDAAKLMQEYPFLTGIFIGEGEGTFAEVVSLYAEGKEEEKLSEIPGLYLKSGMTGEREPLDLTTIPFLYDDLEPFSNRIIYYETQRGCPFRCSYCLSSIDKTVRFRDIHVVEKELQFFLDRKVKQVKFVDRTFNCNHEHAMAIWQYLYENDNGVTNFHFEIAGVLLREDELALIGKMRPGLVQFEIGVQSTNPDTLREIRRVMDIKKLKTVVEALKKTGNVHVHLDLIAGLPYENYESFARSFDEVYAMEPDQLQLGFLKVLKGSYMAEKAKEYGLTFTDSPPYEVLCTKWLSFMEVRRLKRIEEMVEIYHNSGQFGHILPVLIFHFKDKGGAFSFFEALADYYEDHGFFVETPSRVYRYQVLLSFAEEWDKENLPLYRELLTFDLYIRENLKSRPDFAADLKPYREELHALKLPGTAHAEPFTYPVWEKDISKIKKFAGHKFAVFYYEKRHPLTGEAAVKVLPEKTGDENGDKESTFYFTKVR